MSQTSSDGSRSVVSISSPAPALPPVPHGLDHRPEFLAGRREEVFRALPIRAAPTLDDPGRFQPLQPLRQQRARHQRQASMQVIEFMAAEDKLPQQERRPALGQDSGRLGNRQNCAILHDSAKNRTARQAVPVQILHERCYWRDAAGNIKLFDTYRQARQRVRFAPLNG